MATSPTQRSLKLLRDAGYTVAITEHWNNFARIRVDLFGFLDLLALGDGEVIGVQTTSYSNISARIKKIQEHENVAAVRKAGIRIIVHGWAKGKNGRWTCKEVDIS